MVKGARQREWPRHLSTHTHTHWTLPTTLSVLETPFDIHVSSVYQTHTCMQAPIPTLCISAKKTHNKGSRTRPIMSTLMPRSGIPVICSRATLSCDSSYFCWKNVRIFCSTKDSHIFPAINNGVFLILMFQILMFQPLYFEQLAPGLHSYRQKYSLNFGYQAAISVKSNFMFVPCL